MEITGTVSYAILLRCHDEPLLQRVEFLGTGGLRSSAEVLAHTCHSEADSSSGT